MIARDGDTCPAPYCDRPSAWSDGHHLIPVEAGGKTTVANGALPCEGHHLLLHEGRWTLQRLPDGRYLMHHPATGRTLGPGPPDPATTGHRATRVAQPSTTRKRAHTEVPDPLRGRLLPEGRPRFLPRSRRT
jgi:hypothetical protein